MTQQRTKRTFSDKQNKQLVKLYQHGKPRSEIIREYGLTASAFDKWVKRISATGPSHGRDNRTPAEQERLNLRIGNLQLRMVNDVLTQAALIFVRK